MNKTLLKKLTEIPAPSLTLSASRQEDVALSNMLRNAASELLSPRPQAIANLLKMAKTV